MPRVRRVAVLGVIALFGVAGCTAQANSGSTGESASPAAAQQTASSRQDIEVQLQPARAKAGQRVWVLANCPIPEGGPEHRGTASSEAFRGPVTLDPILATPSPSATASSTPTARPWVRGQATVATGAKAGVYDVNTRCEGTNDTGKASLRVVADAKPTSEPGSKPTRTVITTHGPGTGGGGTAAGGPHDESGMPFGVTGTLLVVALAGGAGLVVMRRRRS
ncbi:hypothetical protein [Streptosporangium carneum]|uniref:Gram-positive cocci surface proteins LPxTG domain-containing protein n=1 Tax=Streptosporangium carneum TaxID=47481 RepID=A0A9W6MEQ5_9ACTN|nr:hypothetical protein [Streptosporangium carneum]GLK11844.1 hypothetical protein GCM10017600_52520 [Streptosporangium carneum]